MTSRIRVTPRGFSGPAVRFGVPLGALVVALLIGGVIVAIAGNNPIEAYRTMFDSSLNGWRAISRTLALATPLILAGLAAAVAFQMRVYNIGGEGQLYLGAIASTWVGLALPASTPIVLMLSAMVIGGALAGAFWALLAAIPKAFFNADEIITTLMLNFVALSLLNWLIFGSRSFWRDPDRPVPLGRRLPDSAILPSISGLLHIGIIIAVVAAVLLWFLLRKTSWGFQVRTIGDSPRAARYAGMSVRFKTLAVLALSGALAAIAGVSEASGVAKRLDPIALETNIGFTGIIIAVVARSNPLGVVPVSIFLAAISTAGNRLQSIGIDAQVVVLLQGLIFLTVTAGEFLVMNKVSLSGPPPATETATGSPPSDMAEATA